MKKPARVPSSAAKVKPPSVVKPKRGQLKVDLAADLAAAISGKDHYADVLRMSDADVLSNIHGVVSTQSIAIDCATGIGGFPRGRLVEIYGQEGVGKTTLWQAVMAQTQKEGGFGALHDSEEKVDRNYAARMGVDIERLLAIQPDQKTVEAIVETTDRALDFWMTHHEVPLTVVWDSVAGTATEDEMENPTAVRKKSGELDVHGFSPASAARALRRACRQLIGKIARSNALVIAINQQYVRVGAYSPRPGSVSYATYGGGGIRYHATMRLELARTGMLKDHAGNVVGIEGICKIFKNNLAVSRDEEFAIQWGRGIVNAWSIFQKLRERKYITTSGPNYRFQTAGGQPVEWAGGWQGLEALLVQFPEVYAAMADVYTKLPPGAAKG